MPSTLHQDVYFQIEEVWDTVVKFVHGEFEIIVEIVGTLLDFAQVFWFDEQKVVVHVTKIH